jgi:multiple sugar transport system substrate-binding protein
VDCFQSLTGQVVNHIQLPPAADDQRAQLMSELQAGNQEYDVLGLDIIWTQEFAKAGLIYPLEEVAGALGENAEIRRIDLDRYFESVRDSVHFDGRDWAVPLHANAGLLYFNTDYIQPEDVPGTWKEMAAWLQHPGNLPDGVAGYLGQFWDYEGLTVNASVFAWAFGGGFVDDDGHVPDDLSGTLDGLRFLARGFSEGWIPEAALGYREQESLAAFNNGDAVFLHHWPYGYARLKDPESPVSNKFGVTQLPGMDEESSPGPNVLGGANLAISRHSQRPRAAYELIEFLTSEPVQRRVAERGGYPTAIESVYTDGEESTAPAEDPDAALAEQIDSQCLQDEDDLSPPLEDRQVPPEVLQGGLRNARSRPATPYYDRVTALIHGQVHEWLQRAGGQPSLDGSNLIKEKELEDFADGLRAAMEGR